MASSSTGDAAFQAANPRILKPGRNCWRVETAHRAAFLIEPATYFNALRSAMMAARRSILILGWEFDPETCLDPPNATPEEPHRLKGVLNKLVAEKPELQVNILIWDASILFRPALPKLFETPIDAHPRITLAYDGKVPVGGSHHDKVVVVDDAVAFVGGVDLTGHRWDTRAHTCKEPLRRTPAGTQYGPVHDMMMAVDGPAAASVAALARARWLEATGTALPELDAAGSDPWPDWLEPDVRDTPVGIVRTMPALGEREAVHEVAALNEDALGSARKWIYIETQYFASSRVADALVELLQHDDPPEIVVVVRYQCNGWIEEFVMGSNRDRLLRKVREADTKGRFRAYHALLEGPEEEPNRHLNVHAKLVMVDGRLLRIGSSNLNNRSMGLDTECDLVVEAADGETEQTITALRDRLLAEHLDVAEEVFARAAAEHGLIGAIEALNVNARCLVRFEATKTEGPSEPIAGTAVLDPEEPIDLGVLRSMLPASLTRTA